MNSEQSTSPFSVVLPVYQGDNPEHLEEAISSTLDQTVMPSELLIVEDGDLTSQLYTILDRWGQRHPIVVRRICNDSNRGLSRSLIKGVERASNEHVARMDADDVCVQNRFEKQIKYLTHDDSVDVVGGYIREFSADESDGENIRIVPTDHEEIRKMARFRNPMNHVTVMFKRDQVLSVGNYRPVNRMEDYDLWVRLLLDGATFSNIPDVLVNVRAGDEMYSRRGGLEYAREELRMQREFYSWEFISLFQFFRNLFLRTGLRFVPNTLRGLVYEQFARK
jgi:glycosyltransferase involved in cell wall biosynthesis